jgi:hypothetical protein
LIIHRTGEFSTNHDEPTTPSMTIPGCPTPRS